MKAHRDTTPGSSDAIAGFAWMADVHKHRGASFDTNATVELGGESLHRDEIIPAVRRREPTNEEWNQIRIHIAGKR